MVEITKYYTTGVDKMGLFGGGSSSDQQSASDEIIRKQYYQNQKEIAQKRKALYQERLDIIKSQGGQTWTPNRNSGKGNKAPNTF